MLNPFEQFSPYQVHLFVDFKLNGCSNTNFSMSLAFIIMLIFVVFTYTSGFTASGLNGLVLRAVENVKAIVQTNLHTARNQYFPPLMYLFFTILLANAMGMTPFSITLTSSLVFTTFLALTYYLGANITGVARNEWKMMSLFLPKGLPLIISALLINIELVSYVARGFSLSIRLFANMFAGHVLLKLMSTLAVTCLFSAPVLAVLQWILMLPIVCLEFLVAYLQAYVFTLLVTLYINDVLNTDDH